MSPCDRECFLKIREPDYAFLNRLSLAIDAYLHEKGDYPAAILMEHNQFWKTIENERSILRPGYVIEFEGVRVIPTADLNGKLYLVSELVEVPDVILPKEEF